MKVPRTKKEAGSGKGGFWKLSPDYERQRSSSSTQSQSSSNLTNNSSSNKRFRQSKRSSPSSSTTLSNTSPLHQLLIDNSTPLIKSSSHISHENIKSECWIDPILPGLVPKLASPISCSTNHPDRTYLRMPSSFLSPTSSPEALITVSPFQPQPLTDFSAILTPSPSNSPSSMSSGISKTKFDETDMLLLDSSTFDWDAYLCETPADLDVQPLLSIKTEQDLFNDFNAALTDLTSVVHVGTGGNETDSTTFDAFDYTTRNSLFDDEEHSNPLENFSVKGSTFKRPFWWMNHETNSSTKLPSLQAAFDLKLPKLN